MANKAISELPQAQNVNNQDLFVLEQGGLAKKLPAETFITEQGIINALAEALDGHGGIQSVTLSSVSGRIRTYRITFTDQSATTFQVYDGTSIDRISRTSSSGLDDVYTIFLSDGTTTFFTVHNGADGTVSEAMLNDALKDKAPAVTETTESSAIANFTDGADNMVMHHVIAEINPVQSGSGDPSPSNIRPITGWTGANVTRTGINVWDEEWENGRFNLTTGVKSSGNGLRSENKVRVIPNTVYHIVCGAYGANSVVLLYYDMNENFISYEVKYSLNTNFTTPIDACFVNFNLQTSSAVTTYNNDISINYPSSDHDYHAYQSNTVTLSWQTEAGTVYGGTIDVATGLLTVDRAYKNVSLSNFDYNASINCLLGYASYNIFNDAKAPTSNSTKFNAIADAISINSASSINGGADGLGITTTKDIYLRSSGLTSKAEYLAAFPNGINVVYELATPQTYQLNPQQLMTILGTNNVWADVGNVSVTYPADTKMFIEKLTMPTEDDLVANQAITSGKYFMIGNSLYLALANIASGAQITIGTNAQRVSLADALNTINA